MKKHLFILAILFSMAMIPEAFAYNFQSGGIYYDITSPNTVAVTYATGSYNSYSGTVDIPSTVTYNGTTYTVTAIGNSAFRNSSNLTGVSIPNTVTSIGDYAFYYCNHLTSVTIPNGVETIGSYAFQSCNGMTTLSLGNTLTSIGQSAFQSCSGLTAVSIPNSVTSIGNSAFQSCSGLTAVSIPNSVTSIGNSAFQSCNGLLSLAFGESVISIGNSAFQSCGNLISITIPQAVKTIGDYAFRYCNSLSTVLFNADSCEVMGSSSQTVFANCIHLTHLTIGNNAKSIPEYAFKGCDSLTTLFIPGAISYIAPSAFINCNHISAISVSSQNAIYDSRNNCNAIIHTPTNTLIYGCNNSNIPNSVRAIGEHAFSGRTGLTGAFTIPDSVTVIGASAFYGCSGLTSLTIGRKVDSIGISAFAYCTGLVSLTYNADSCTAMGHSTIYYVNESPTTVFSGCNNLSSLSIGNNVKVIPDYAFCGLNHISGMLLLPDSLTYIGNYAFGYCSNLTGTLIIPNIVSTIGSGAFYNCSGLTALNYNADSCVFVGWAFGNCTNLSTLIIGDNVKIIPDMAFSGCSSLTGEIIIPNSVKSIGFNAFRNCSGFTGPLSLPLSIKHIDACAFYNCTGLSGELVIHDSLISIGYWAFYNCESLTSLVIGKSVQSIGHSAFYSCTGLSSVIFNPDNCTEMGNGDHCFVTQNTTYCPVFQDCSNLTTITIGENVKNIPHFAFAGCSALTSITIPRSVSHIGDYAFSGCDNITTVVFNPDSCSGLNIFQNCTSITSISFGEYVKIIPAGIFSGCSGLIGRLNLPNSITIIERDAFSGCSGFTGPLVIPDSTTYIKSGSFSGCSGFDTLIIGKRILNIESGDLPYRYPPFYNCMGLSTVYFNADSCSIWNGYWSPLFSTCSNLTTVIVGDNVNRIPEYAFYKCDSLSTLVIGKSVKSIGQQSFNYCNNLSTVVFNADRCNIMDNVFPTSNNITSLIIGSNVKKIPDNAFQNCNNLTGTLIIPDSLTSIGASAFEGCVRLDSLIIGNAVTSIGNRAFYNCNQISGWVVIPNAATSIGNIAFCECSKIDSLIIGKSVQTIGYHAFYGCSRLAHVAFNADSCNMDRVFENCSNFNSLRIGNNVKHILPSAFRGCSSLTGTLIIPDSVKFIGENSFYGCSGLDSLVIGRSVTSIGSRAFYGCSSATGTLSIPNNVLSIGGYAFQNCSGLNALVIGSSVTSIGSYAFSGCTSLTGTLTIPNSVTIIESYAFKNCSSLTSLVLGRSVESIGSYTFGDCSGLTSISSYAINAPSYGGNSTFNNVNRSTPLYVPCGRKSNYQSTWTYSDVFNTKSYFYNVYETLSSYLLAAIPEDTLKGSVQITTQATCTTPAVIEATPNFFYVFDHWSDGNTDNPRNVSITQDTTLIAYFREYSMTINCDTTYGHIVVLQAPTAENPQAVIEVVPTRCYLFGYWYDITQNGWGAGYYYDNPRTITLTKDTTVYAYFRYAHPVEIISNGTRELCEGDSTVLKGFTYSNVWYGDTSVATNSFTDGYLWLKEYWTGTTYAIDTLGLADSIIVTESGTYLVVGIDSSGCTAYDSREVTFHKYPMLILSGKADICEGDTAMITASSYGNYELMEDFSNGIPSDWTISNNVLQTYDLGGNHGNAILFPGYDLPSNTVEELILPDINISYFSSPRLDFDMAYRRYNSSSTEKLRVFMSTDDGSSWDEIYTSGSSSNIYDSFYPTDDQWSTKSIYLSNNSETETIKLKFEFSGGQGNNLWLDNIHLYSTHTNYYNYDWSNGSSERQQTFTTPGTWQVSVSKYGCTTTDSVTVNVWQPSDTVEVTITSSNGYYVMNGEAFCTSGDYIQNLQNMHGCDSVIVLHLTVPSEPTVVNDTVYGYYSYYGEDGTRASIDGYKYSYRYQMTPDKYPHWADSILAYQAAHPNYTQYTLSYDSTTNMASMSYIYIYDYKRISGSSYYRIIYPDYNIWKDSTYYDVSDTLTGTSSVGCDFTVIWNTRIMLGEGQDVYLEECGGFIWQGDSIYTSGTTDTGYAAIGFVSGDTLTESDTYYSHEYNTNISGCDSSIYLYFTIRPTAYEEVVENACESYTLNGITYTESGVYTQYSDTTLVITRNLFWKNSNWCYWNSLGFLRTYRPAGWSNRYTGYEEYYVDDHWEYDYTYYYYDGNGNTIYLDSANQVVVYVDTVNACKMLTLNLTINNSVSESVEVTACDSYTWNDSVYSQSGDYIQTLTAANGCDSVVTLHLTITNTDYTDYTDEACDSYTWNGVIYTTSDDYTQTFTNMAGCDSVVTLHLTVNASDHTELTAAACGQYVWLDSTYTESGDYSVTYTNTMDCDSIVTLHLTINPIPEVAITGSTTICPGGGTMLTATGADTYLWSNFSSNASVPVNMFGVYSVTGTTSAGCFNSASVTVLIAQPPVITITGNTDLCAGESTTLTANGGVTYMWSNGSTDTALTVNAAGSWQVIGYDENGCNGMASTTVNVWQPATSSLYITSFDSCYTWFGTPYCLSGDYTHTLQTIHGCDSIITLHLTLEDAIMTEFSATSCNSYTWNGITYSQSGNYIQNFAAVNGNDSIVTLHLMINYSTTGDTTAVACNSFTWHGTIYTQSGNYTYSTTNAAGCDSVTTLHLTINQPSTGDTTAIACENFTWEGTTYTVSGDYTSYKTNAAGCDSIVTLHLIINQPTAGDTTAVACESFTWHGNTYTQSGNYTFSTINVAGCDSVATLHLTINQPTTGDTTAVVCENFTWHGNTYSQSGNYTYTTTNVAGCDSVVTLHLTVMADFVPQVTVSGTLTACGNETVTLSLAGTYHDYLWSTGDTTATITVGTAGYYWVTIGDGTGCTSVSEPVHLGVSESVSETPALCMVGVVGNHNMVVWEELTDPDVVGYQLYRENGQANVFEPLTFVPAGIVNAYEDITADPSIRAYRYKITAVDTCGGETPMSEYHKTVHLTINQGLGNSYNLIWTPYEGFEFASYRLYRGTANNNLQLIQTMPSTLTSFTDNNPTGDALFYQIEVVMNGSCVQHTRDITFTGARSNIVYNGMPVTTDVSVSACDSYDWNGQHLTTSGDYTQSFTSQFGYDSVVTLHLTVNNSAASDFTIVTEEPCYTWNGIDYCTSGDYTQTLQTLHGCDSVVTLHLTITVGLNDYDNFDFKVYPNPTNGVVNVECMMKIEEWDNAEIHVVDMYGKLLQTKPFDGETSHVDLTRYANGFYFVKLMVEDKTIAVRKVVKE